MREIVIRILITGATGFLGRFLVGEIKGEHDLILTTRNDVSSAPEMTQLNLACTENLHELFDGVDTVVHTAALVHQMNPVQAPSRNEYFEINAAATIRLAEAAG